jgi:hypothetical protein
MLNTASPRFDRLAAILARTDERTTPHAGERTAAHAAARRLILAHPELLAERLRVVLAAAPFLPAVALAHTLIGIYADSCDAGAADCVAVNVFAEMVAAALSTEALAAAQTALAAERKPVAGVYTGDHLREIGAALWPLERESAARVKAA